MKLFNHENIHINHDHTEILASLLTNVDCLTNELNKLILYLKTSKKNIGEALSVLSRNNFKT